MNRGSAPPKAENSIQVQSITAKAMAIQPPQSFATSQTETIDDTRQISTMAPTTGRRVMKETAAAA